MKTVICLNILLKNPSVKLAQEIGLSIFQFQVNSISRKLFERMNVNFYRGARKTCITENISSICYNLGKSACNVLGENYIGSTRNLSVIAEDASEYFT
jgi:hypothetical protein